MATIIPPYIPPPSANSTSAAGTQSSENVQEQEKPHGHKGHGGGSKPHAAKTGLQHGGGQHLQRQLMAEFKRSAEQQPIEDADRQSNLHVDDDSHAGAAHPGAAFPLHAAVRAQNRALFERLLAGKADINAVDGNGDMPLDLALKMFEKAREKGRQALRHAGFFVTALAGQGALTSNRVLLGAVRGWLDANASGA